MGYIKHWFTDGTYFEILDGKTSYGVNAIVFPFNGEYVEKTDLDGNQWYWKDDGSYCYHYPSGGRKETSKGTYTGTQLRGLRLSYFREDGSIFISGGSIPYATVVYEKPTSGYAIYMGTDIIPRPALAFYAGSVTNFGGSRCTEEDWRTVFPLSTGQFSKTYPITYYEIHSNLSGPSEAAAGEEVTVDVSFPDGYKLKDTTRGSGIMVYNDNGYIDYTYDETTKKLKFTMP